MSSWVEISFDCLPLRSVGRIDIPLDASPNYRARCERIAAAIKKHGRHNAYYVYNAQCQFHFTNDAQIGSVCFQFEGTVMTDASDTKAQQVDLQVELSWENCEWLNEPIVQWLSETVRHAAQVEFDRYIQAGDLSKTQQRVDELQQQLDQSDGFLGMYL